MNIKREGKIEVITNKETGEIEYHTVIKVAGELFDDIYNNYQDAEARRKVLHEKAIEVRTTTRRKNKEKNPSKSLDNKFKDICDRIVNLTNIITLQAAKTVNIERKLDKCIVYYQNNIKQKEGKHVQENKESI